MTAAEKDKDNYELRKRMMLWAPALYFFILILVAIHSFKKPEYNWDILPYMALVLKADNTNIDAVHRLTYIAAQQNLPAPTYKNLTDTSNAYRKKMSEDSDAFNNQLPFYVIKPLYISFAYAFYKVGFSLPASTVLPSIFSYLLIGLLLLYWLKKYLSIFFSSSVSLLVMLSSPMLEIAKLSTPDALSAFLLLSSFYFVLEKQNKMFMFILMIASIFTRVDNLITCVAIIGLLAFFNKPLKKQSIIQYGSMALILFLCYFLITASTASYGWSMFYNNLSSHHTSSANGFHSAFILKDYLHILYANLLHGLYYSNIIIFLVMILSLFIKRPPASLKNINFDQLFSLLIVLIIIAKFILYPDMSDRYYIPFYLVAVILIIRMMAGKEEIPFPKK